MKLKSLRYLTLVSCFLFLIGNIVYDWLDTPEYPADSRIFYVPLSVMIFMFLTYTKKTCSPNEYPFWWFFWWLSIGQLVKFILFNPYLQMLSDYVFLGIITIGLLIKLICNARSSTPGSD